MPNVSKSTRDLVARLAAMIDRDQDGLDLDDSDDGDRSPAVRAYGYFDEAQKALAIVTNWLDRADEEPAK